MSRIGEGFCNGEKQCTSRNFGFFIVDFYFSSYLFLVAMGVSRSRVTFKQPTNFPGLRDLFSYVRVILKSSKTIDYKIYQSV